MKVLAVSGLVATAAAATAATAGESNFNLLLIKEQFENKFIRLY